MSEKQLLSLLTQIRKPVFDPLPIGVRFDRVQTAKFKQIQARLNSKIAKLEAQKMRELSKIISGALK